MPTVLFARAPGVNDGMSSGVSKVVVALTEMLTLTKRAVLFPPSSIRSRRSRMGGRNSDGIFGIEILRLTGLLLELNLSPMQNYSTQSWMHALIFPRTYHS